MTGNPEVMPVSLFADHTNTGGSPLSRRDLKSIDQELAAKRGYRGCFVIPHVENGVELGDLQ
jgi:hypothetical protein